MKKTLLTTLVLALFANMGGAYADDKARESKEEIRKRYEAREKARDEASYQRWLKDRKNYDQNSKVAKSYEAWVLAGLDGYGMNAEYDENRRKNNEAISKSLNNHLNGYNDVHDFPSYVAKTAKPVCKEGQDPKADNCFKEPTTEAEFYQALREGDIATDKAQQEAEARARGEGHKVDAVGKAAVDAWKKKLTKK